MTKDMEAGVVLWPMWESLGGAMYADVNNDRLNPVNVFYNMEVKRLKDTELAAEYQAARAELWEARAACGPVGDGFGLTGQQMENSWKRKRLYALLEGRVETMKRFAETRHHTRTDGTEHN